MKKVQPPFIEWAYCMFIRPIFAWSLFFLFSGGSAFCQLPSAPDNVDAFAPAQRHILDELGALSSLADGTWMIHDGSVPHGEDISLDISDWKPARLPLDTGEDSVWFRQSFVVPEKIHGLPALGARISFQFGAFAHGGIQEIVYFNGRRVALGESLEPITLTEHAVPGEHILIAVKLLHSSGGKHVTPSTFPVNFAGLQPSPTLLRDECLSARMLLPLLINKPEELVEANGKLSEALGEINLEALSRGDTNTFSSSLGRAQDALAVLRPTLKKSELLLVGQSHIDSAWLWPWTDTIDAVRRTFFTTLQLMEEYPRFRYTQSALVYYQWMEEKYPDLFAGIQQRIRDGRWEVVGGMWVEPDLNMPDGETTVRELLLGTQYAKEHLGVDIHVGWNPDSFGFTWQLPQIYRKSGIPYFMTEKLAWNDENTLPLKLFWWQSPDGSKVLTYLGSSQFAGFRAVPLIDDLRSMEKLAPGAQASMPIYGVGDHGGGVTRTMLDAAEELASPASVFPTLNFSSSFSFFSSLAPRVDTPDSTWNYGTLAARNPSLPEPAPGRVEIPTWNDELYLELHRGTYTTQAQHKRHMRESEEQLLNAEKLSSLAWLQGATYPQIALNDSWKKAAFNGFHDLAAGSGTSNIYVDAERDFDSIRQTTALASDSALEILAAKADTGGDGSAVLLFNPMAWMRQETVELKAQLVNPSAGVKVTGPDGKNLPVQVLSNDAETGQVRVLVRVQAPSMGYAVVHVQGGGSETITTLRANATTLENNLLRVDVDPATGCISHLVDKRAHFDALAKGACGNQLQTFTDLPQKYDAWNIDASALDTMRPITGVDSVKLIESGPLRADIRVERHWGSSHFIQDIVLYDDSDRVEIWNDIDWHETHVLLKAAFPLAASSSMATYEIPFGTIQRPTTRNNSFDRAKFEVPALRWADLGDGEHGLSLINESKYGYDAAGHVLRLSLLRSPVYPDPNADRGRNVFRFALYPHAGTWQTAQTMHRAWEFNYPLLIKNVQTHRGTLGATHSFLQVEGDGVLLTSMKRSENGEGLILRLFEWTGENSRVRIHLPGHPESVSEMNLMEHTDASLHLALVHLETNTVTVSFAPSEIKTIQVNYAPTHDQDIHASTR